jgi:hypothetical protein
MGFHPVILASMSLLLHQCRICDIGLKNMSYCKIWCAYISNAPKTEFPVRPIKGALNARSILVTQCS